MGPHPPRPRRALLASWTRLRRLPSAPIAALAVATIALGACSLGAPGDTAVRVTGRVVDASAGDPIPGVAVFLYQQSSIVVPLGEARTGADGRFAVDHDDGEYPHTLVLGVNQGPRYQSSYGSYRQRVTQGTVVDLGDIALERLEP
ncbi:hypothetical protein [Rubrivirga sp.]|uniref:hypothetical protein n=1 Tax=Rubrivirga sp. TaxID=1885344 RepID=UPI003C70D6BF